MEENNVFSDKHILQTVDGQRKMGAQDSGLRMNCILPNNGVICGILFSEIQILMYTTEVVYRPIILGLWYSGQSFLTI